MNEKAVFFFSRGVFFFHRDLRSNKKISERYDIRKSGYAVAGLAGQTYQLGGSQKEVFKF